MTYHLMESWGFWCLTFLGILSVKILLAVLDDDSLVAGVNLLSRQVVDYFILWLSCLYLINICAHYALEVQFVDVAVCSGNSDAYDMFASFQHSCKSTFGSRVSVPIAVACLRH